jgi:putative endopeptidase
MKPTYAIAVMATFAFTWACTPKTGNQIAQTVLPDIITPAGQKKFIDPANMDLAVKPGDDFYQYANGAWLKSTPIPPTESVWGSFPALRDFNQQALKDILEEAAAKSGEKGSPLQKVGDFFASGMDTLAIEKAGWNPIKPYFERIDKLNSMKSLLDEIGRMHVESIDPLFSFYASVDEKNSTQFVPYLAQGGIHLPDRDYFFKTDARTLKIRDAYKVHIVNVFKLLGDKEADAVKNREIVMRFETALANACMTRTELRDPQKIYNKMTIKEIHKLSPLIDWKDLLKTMLVNADTLIVQQPKFVTAMDELLRNEKLDEWKIYLKWCVAKGAMTYLSDAFVKENFNFAKNMTGQKQQQPRWKRVSLLTDRALGDLVGQIYVAKHFTPEAKQRMTQLVENLSITYQKRIQNLDWMSPVTKQKALGKLGTFMRKIGYPDKWQDLSSINIVRDNYWANVLTVNDFQYKDMVHRIGKPVDRTRWQMTPPTVNAYYNPTLNEIVFPAGILQFPFFDNAADDAVNYGGIGAVIGHEMTHGFDDEGRQYDAEGNLKDWWTKEDGEKFDVKAKMIEEQYSNFRVLDTVKVNGKLTLGENLADLGGLNLAYDAFKTFTKQGKTNQKIDGFTPDQRFFLSWAQVWRQNIRDEALMQRVMSDPHSPSVFRCNGPIAHMPEFYTAFGVKQGDKLWKLEKDRTKIW